MIHERIFIIRPLPIEHVGIGFKLNKTIGKNHEHYKFAHSPIITRMVGGSSG